MLNSEPHQSLVSSLQRDRSLAPRPSNARSGAEIEDGNRDLGLALRRSVMALRRYKWLVLAILFLSVGIAFAIRGRFSAVYEAEGKVWLSQDGQMQRGPVRAEALLPSNSWGDLLVSYAVLGKVVRELHLYVRPIDPRNGRLFNEVDANDVVRGGLYTLRVDTAAKRYTLSSRDPDVKRPSSRVRSWIPLVAALDFAGRRIRHRC